MLRWLKGSRGNRPAEKHPSIQDPILGTLEWDAEVDAWVARVDRPSPGFRILIAGAGTHPDERLLPHAREVFASPEKLLNEVEALIKDAAERIPEATDEIRGLRIDSIALLWPDRPADGMVFFDSPAGAEGRAWRCDCLGGRPCGLTFDN